MPEFKVGDRVESIVDCIDGNQGLPKGSKGTIWQVLGREDRPLVLWDTSTDDAEENDDLCDTYGYEYSGRFWFVDAWELKLSSNFPQFRKQKRGERIKAYRIAKKIYELDMQFKERQDAKANTVSVQNQQRECEEVIECSW